MKRDKDIVGIYEGNPLNGGVLVDWVEAVVHYTRYYTFGPAVQRYIRYKGKWLKVSCPNVPGRHAYMYAAQVGDWFMERKG